MSGVVEDNKDRRSPVPFGGLELEVKSRLGFKALGEIVYKMKQLIKGDLCIQFSQILGFIFHFVK